MYVCVEGWIRRVRLRARVCSAMDVYLPAHRTSRARTHAEVGWLRLVLPRCYLAILSSVWGCLGGLEFTICQRV